MDTPNMTTTRPDTIIAGRFGNIVDAEAAMAALQGHGIAASDICQFYNAPPGQHGLNPGGGDEPADPGAKYAHVSAAATSAVGGLGGAIAGSAAGPIWSVAGAGIGAYVGSLLGTLAGLGARTEPEHARRRLAGVMVAVRIPSADRAYTVINVLRVNNAAEIERAKGTWHNGDWVDFNPLHSPCLIDSDPDARDDVADMEAVVPPGNAVLTVMASHGRWHVFKRDVETALASFQTHAQALTCARALADKAPGTEVRLLGANGALLSREVSMNHRSLNDPATVEPPSLPGSGIQRPAPQRLYR